MKNLIKGLVVGVLGLVLVGAGANSNIAFAKPAKSKASFSGFSKSKPRPKPKPKPPPRPNWNKSKPKPPQRPDWNKPKPPVRPKVVTPIRPNRPLPRLANGAKWNVGPSGKVHPGKNYARRMPVDKRKKLRQIASRTPKKNLKNAISCLKNGKPLTSEMISGLLGLLQGIGGELSGDECDAVKDGLCGYTDKEEGGDGGGGNGGDGGDGPEGTDDPDGR